jgi:hypothetical protein
MPSKANLCWNAPGKFQVNSPFSHVQLSTVRSITSAPNLGINVATINTTFCGTIFPNCNERYSTTDTRDGSAATHWELLPIGNAAHPRSNGLARHLASGFDFRFVQREEIYGTWNWICPHTLSSSTHSTGAHHRQHWIYGKGNTRKTVSYSIVIDSRLPTE